MIASKLTQFRRELKLNRLFNSSYHGELVHLSSSISFLSHLKAWTFLPRFTFFNIGCCLSSAKKLVVMYWLWHHLYKDCWFSYFLNINAIIVISRKTISCSAKLSLLLILKITLGLSTDPFKTLLINQMNQFFKKSFSAFTCSWLLEFF